LLNFVMIIGVKGWNNHNVNETMEVAVNTKTVLNLPLREVLKLTSARPHIGKRVFVVENSGFAVLFSIAGSYHFVHHSYVRMDNLS